MVWAVRILVGLVAMTAPYVLTVAQVRVVTANQNICDLADAALAWKPPYCGFHILYVWIWVCGLVLAIGYFAFECSTYVRKAAAPHGGVIVVCRRRGGSAVHRFKSAGAKVAPFHIILIGLAIAIGGVVWQLYRSGGSLSGAQQVQSSQDVTVTATKIPAPAPEVVASIKAPLEAEIASLKKQLAETPKPNVAALPQTNSNSPSIGPQMPTVAVVGPGAISREEFERRSKVLWSLHAIVNDGALYDALVDGFKIFNEVPNNLATRHSDLLNSMEAFQKVYSNAADAYNNARRAGDGFDDVRAKELTHPNLSSANGVFIKALQGWNLSNSGQSVVSATSAAQSWKDSFAEFARWMQTTKPLIKAKIDADKTSR